MVVADPVGPVINRFDVRFVSKADIVETLAPGRTTRLMHRAPDDLLPAASNPDDVIAIVAQNVPKLEMAVSDANAVAASLRSIGFEVLLATDVGRTRVHNVSMRVLQQSASSRHPEL